MGILIDANDEFGGCTIYEDRVVVTSEIGW